MREWEYCITLDGHKILTCQDPENYYCWFSLDDTDYLYHRPSYGEHILYRTAPTGPYKKARIVRRCTAGMVVYTGRGSHSYDLEQSAYQGPRELIEAIPHWEMISELMEALESWYLKQQAEYEDGLTANWAV